MFYYEIRPDSSAYQKICESIMDYARWLDDKIQEKICQLLSVPSTEGIYFNSLRLTTKNPPAGHIHQFAGPNKNGYYTAHRDSSINKLWVEFCKQNGLKFYRPLDILDLDCGLIRYGGKKVFYPLGARFYIKSEVKMDKDFLINVSEAEFETALAEFTSKFKKIA